ncbi:AzlD domain-containing protein [Aerococcaceae bacterium DSM 111021]|nr:AzlD domain-containing protein [Aerococcaceae bacterium DSM 111021]
MMNNVYLYLLLSGVVLYMMRMIPMTLAREQIKHPFIRSFLYYVPYVTLSVMTFPAILQVTQTPISGLIALLGAILMSWRGANLIQVAVTSCMLVFIVELFLI